MASRSLLLDRLRRARGLRPGRGGRAGLRARLPAARGASTPAEGVNMGCDIHLAVERREGGEWKRVDPKPDQYEPWLVELYEKNPAGLPRHVTRSWYSERNYSAFAILAGVRQRGAGFVPISEPRDLPPDISRAAQYDDDDMGLGDHSHSWLTLAELLAFDWQQVGIEMGIIDASEWVGLVRANAPRQSPRSYCQGVSGRVFEERAAAAEFFGASAREATRNDHVWHWWPTTYAEAAGGFYTRFLPLLQTLGAPDDVRIVFGFDS